MCGDSVVAGGIFGAQRVAAFLAADSAVQPKRLESESGQV